MHTVQRSGNGINALVCLLISNTDCREIRYMVLMISCNGRNYFAVAITSAIVDNSGSTLIAPWITAVDSIKRPGAFRHLHTLP